jgi:YARHG domain
MKLSLCLPVACVLAFAGILPAQDADTKPYNGEEDVNVPHAEAKMMLGTYVGAFGQRKITICLDRVVGNTVTGYSIVAGNERAFSGSFTRVIQGFSVVAKEPGDHKDDGVFNFLYMQETKSLVGEWVANNPQIGVRKFDLPARKFKYNPKAGKYPQSSTRALTEKDVENLKNEELRIMRNEIYARHGYSFKLADMRDHFDKLDWYMPLAVDITTKLTKVEKNNAALIKRYEKYSAEYYDGFGR